jgi:(p)ppGpp synthase/HD superfamily hydrolase
MEKLKKAIEFAWKAHGEQKRKYTGEPYIEHPIAVSKKLEKLGFHEDILCAAVLHDVVEDTQVTLHDIEKEFGITISKIVEELTDVYTSEKYPNIARKERKLLECYRLSKAGHYAKSIKLADMIDNTKSIVEHDAGFARTYLREKEEMLNVLHEGENILFQEAMNILKESKKKIFV